MWSKKMFKKNNNFSCSFAMTLAEVLITIGIIGVVCAMTIPTLMQNMQERATIAALRKIMSTLSNAYTLAVQENGTPENWGLAATAIGAENMLNTIATYLNISKNCGRNSGCFPTNYLKLNNDAYTNNIDGNSNMAKVQLADGSLLAAGAYSNCTTYNWGSTPALQNLCGEFYVDINGFKKPNQWGKDLFLFNLTKYGIIPAGTAQYTSGYTFDSCKTSASAIGHTCAAWVIYNENMDYLHCSDLSWGGKTKCD